MSSGPLSFSGRVHARIELHRPEVDVLVECEADVEQDALLQDARADLRVADGAQEDRLELPQFGDDRLGQGLAGLEVALAAEVVSGVVEFEPSGAATAFSTFTPSATTSGPVPSPGITAML